MKTSYSVYASEWEFGWELNIPNIGITQSRDLTEAEYMARDYIHSVTGQNKTDIIISLTVKYKDQW